MCESSYHVMPHDGHAAGGRAIEALRGVPKHSQARRDVDRVHVGAGARRPCDDWVARLAAAGLALPRGGRASRSCITLLICNFFNFCNLCNFFNFCNFCNCRRLDQVPVDEQPAVRDELAAKHCVPVFIPPSVLEETEGIASEVSVSQSLHTNPWHGA